MQFDYIVLYSLKEFNSNKEKEGYFPKDGHVINVFLSSNTGTNRDAVGFKK